MQQNIIPQSDEEVVQKLEQLHYDIEDLAWRKVKTDAMIRLYRVYRDQGLSVEKAYQSTCEDSIHPRYPLGN